LESVIEVWNEERDLKKRDGYIFNFQMCIFRRCEMLIGSNSIPIDGRRKGMHRK